MENLMNLGQLSETIAANKVVNKKDCGIRYFFREVLQLKSESNATLNLFYAIQESLVALNKSKMGNVLISLDTLKEIALKNIDRDFYGTEVEYRFACQSIADLLARYYNWYILQPITVLEVNTSLSVPFDDTNGVVKTLSTKVDAVWEQNDTIHAVVYRNSKPQLSFKRIPKDPSKAGENCVIRDIRLGLVYMGLQSKYPDKMITVSYHHLKNKEDRFERLIPSYNNGEDIGDNIVYCVHDDLTISLVKEDIQKQVTDIFNSKYEVKHNSFTCQQSCEFCTICPEFVGKKEEPVDNPIVVEEDEVVETHAATAVRYNDTQLEAVNAEPQPLRFIAGPGVGKTAVVIGRIKNLMETYGVRPDNILVLTFTNQAVNEVKSRLEKMGSVVNGEFAVYTYNGFGYEVVKAEYSALGFKEEPILASKMQKMHIIYSLLDDLNIQGLNYSDIEQVLEDVYNFTVLSKKRSWIGKPIDKVQDEIVEYFNSTAESIPLYEQLLKATLVIQQEMKKNNWIDYEDQIFLVNKLFSENAAIKAKYQGKFKHILVDEFQDSDIAQCFMVATLAAEHKSIAIIGDEDQAIYAWRGASVSNIMEFQKFFPNLKTITLNQNYRSVKEVIDAANALIKNNSERMGKIIEPTTTEKGVAQIICAPDFEKEKAFISNKILELVQNGYKYSDFAILTRSNACKDATEEYLKSKGIPVYAVGKKVLFRQENIKKAINVLRLLGDLSDDIVAISVLQQYDITLSEVADMVAKKPDGMGIMEYITFAEVSNGLMKTLQPACVEKLSTFLADFNSLSIHSKEANSALLFLSVLELCGQNEDTEKLTQVVADFIGDNEVTYDKIMEFLSMARFYSDDTESEIIPKVCNAVKIITAHSVKGLEFPVVFIANANDFCKNLNTSQQTEEARRLFFVSLSRAKKHVYTLWHDNRLKGRKAAKPKFVEEIEEVCQQVSI